MISLCMTHEQFTYGITETQLGSTAKVILNGLFVEGISIADLSCKYSMSRQYIYEIRSKFMNAFESRLERDGFSIKLIIE